MKSGNLNFLEPSGPLQTCNRTTFYPHLDLIPALSVTNDGINKLHKQNDIILYAFFWVIKKIILFVTYTSIECLWTVWTMSNYYLIFSYFTVEKLMVGAIIISMSLEINVPHQFTPISFSI